MPTSTSSTQTTPASGTPVITVDGPAASGKSSVSRELASRLGWKWVSTGAFYRGLAYVAMKEKIEPTDIPALVKLAHSSIWSVRLDNDQTRVFYKKVDVTKEILSEENGTRASHVSQIPEVRQALLENQRNSATGVTGLVAEGRDCGTVVFPNAILKIYLTASQEERAARRAAQHGLNVKETQNQQQKRDQQDSSRAAAPLQVPPGGRVVDSNGLKLSEVVDTIYSWATQAMAQSVKSF
jgi:cytidylate kinase